MQTNFILIKRKDSNILLLIFIPHGIQTIEKSEIAQINLLLKLIPRRSEPSSRTFLIGEQPNPWDLLQPRDKVSRHRGAELRRR